MRRAAAALLLLLPSGGALRAQEAPLPEPKEVSVPTADGLKLQADLHEPRGGGEGKPAVLALHQEGGDRKAWAATGRLLAEHGISMLAVDLRGHGGSRTQGEEDLGARAEAGDPELWKAMAADAEAGLKWLRGTLLADGKKIGIAGLGAGAALALQAAEGDGKVRALLCAAPVPSAFGLPGMASAVRWDDRPAGILLAEEDERGDAAPLLRQLGKHARTDAILLPGPGKRPPGEFLAGERAAAEAAQFLLGWLERPVLTGKDEEGVHRGGGIFVSGSSIGGGPAAGGFRITGYEAPGKVTGLLLLADPDPTATKLTPESRRVTLVPAKAGKAPAVAAVVERWTGKSWKKSPAVTLLDAGAFVVEGKTTFFQVWVPPSLLGLPPFSRVALAKAPLLEGAPKWGSMGSGFPDPEDPPFGSPGEGRAPRRAAKPGFTVTNPSSWEVWELR